MARFAANLSMMFNEVPFLDRFAGRGGVRISRQWSSCFPTTIRPRLIEQKLRENRLENVLFNMPPGDWAAGERGIGCIPGPRRGISRRSRQGACVRRSAWEHRGSMPWPASLRPEPTAAPCERHSSPTCAMPRRSWRRTASRCSSRPINTRDIPGYFLNTQAESYAICTEINAPNLKMQMDLYHMQIVEGDLAMKLRQYAAHCGHIQIAGVPERQEPDTGEVNYPYLFRAPGRDRLRRMDRLRVPSGGQDRGRPGMVSAAIRRNGVSRLIGVQPRKKIRPHAPALHAGDPGDLFGSRRMVEDHVVP